MAGARPEQLFQSGLDYIGAIEDLMVPSPPGVYLDYNPHLDELGDSSANDHAATLTNGGPLTAVESGFTVAVFSSNRALSFNLGKPSEWTIMAAVKITDTASQQHVCGSRNSGQSNNTAWGVLYNRDTPSAVDGGLRVIWGDGTNQSRIDTDDPVFTEGWDVVAVRFTTGVADVEINAAGNAMSKTATQADASTTAGTAYNFNIGRGGENSTESLSGRIGRLWVWNSRLNDDDFLFYRRRLRMWADQF